MTKKLFQSKTVLHSSRNQHFIRCNCLKMVEIISGNARSARLIELMCMLGILVSFYAYHIETRKEYDRSYTPLCDLSEGVSCSKALTSKYGKGFGLVEHVVGKDSILNQPNSVYGIIYYVVFGFLSEWNDGRAAKAQVVLGVLGNIGSVYLGYILFAVLEDFCIVCVTMYIINAVLLIFALIRSSYIRRLKVSPKMKAK